MEDLLQIVRSKKKTSEQLAKSSGLNERRVAEILTGAEPTMAELRSFAKALRVSVTDLLEAAEDAERIQTLFRHGFYRQVAPRSEAEQQVVKVFSRVFELLGTYQPSNRWFDAVPTIEESYKGAEQLSLWFRATYCGGNFIGPVQRLPAVTEEMLGIPVIVGEGRVDGASVVKRGWPLLYVAVRNFAPRMLFTLAHEVGHLLVHHDLSHEVAFVDQDIENDATTECSGEMLVDAFAATLLVPSQGIGIAFQKIRDLLSIKKNAPVGDIEILFLARIFGVSFSVAANRCEAVDLLPAGGGASLYAQIQREYASPEQKADALGLPEREAVEFPSISKALMNESVKRVREGTVSIGRAAEILKTTIASVTAWNAPTHQQ